MAFSLDEALGMSLADEADESIHVGIDTRQVTIPESQQVFGVESDEDVEVKHIVIDGRYNDGTDLSTFTFRVNYQNANGDKGTYLVTELKVNDSSIEFDWIIGRQVVAYKGTIAFIVCAYTIDSSSVIQNEWNSTLGKGTVLEGLEVSEFDFGDDIVRQLASILSDVNAAQASAKASADEAYKSKTEVVALGKEQQAAIEKKGKDTLATIPEDYAQVSNDVSQLKEATAKLKDGKISKFYASSQGDTTLPDSDDGRIMDLKLYGKSEQKQYSGTNFARLIETDTQSVRVVDRLNGVLEVQGQGTMRKVTEEIPAGNYTINYSNSSNALIWQLEIRDAESKVLDTIIESAVLKKKTFTANAPFFVYIGANIGANYFIKITNFALNIGNAALPFEPYVGGIHSPNPDYPQEIKSVVKPVVKVRGKNLVGKLMQGVIVWNSGGHVSSETQYTCTDFIPVKPGEKYTISNATTSGERWYYDSDKKPVTGMPTGNITVTIPKNISYMRVTCLTENKDKFQIELGPTATAYEPYIESTATLPYTLNAIPVTSGNVTIDGQQYIADYVDVERGKLVRMVGKLTIDAAQISGDANWYNAEKSYSYEINQGNIKPSIKNGGTIVSDCVTGYGFNDFYGKGVETGILSDQPFVVVNISKSLNICTSVDEFIAWFNKSNTIGILAIPTETDLTADEIAAFKALVSYYPVTNVSTTSDQLDGYTVFNYPISLAKGYDYLKAQLGDARDYLYGIDLMTAEAYVNSEYAAALAEIEV